MTSIGSAAPAASGATPSAAAAAGSHQAAAAAVEQMVARLSGLEQGRSALVSLEPPELGRVLVRFMRRGKGWRVQLIAESRDVAQALKNDIGRLSQALGRESEMIDVEVSGDGGQQGSRDPWGSQDGEPGPFGTEPGSPPSEPPVAAAESRWSAAPSNGAGRSGLDVRG